MQIVIVELSVHSDLISFWNRNYPILMILLPVAVLVADYLDGIRRRRRAQEVIEELPSAPDGWEIDERVTGPRTFLWRSDGEYVCLARPKGDKHDWDVQHGLEGDDEVVWSKTPYDGLTREEALQNGFEVMRSGRDSYSDNESDTVSV